MHCTEIIIGDEEFNVKNDSFHWLICLHAKQCRQKHIALNHRDVLISHTHTTRLTFDHVQNVRAHGTNGGQFFFGSKPFLDLQCTWWWHMDVQSQMLEVALQNTTRPLNCHDTWLDGGFNAPWDFHTLIWVDGSHFALKKKQTNLIQLVLLHTKLMEKWKQIVFYQMCEWILKTISG